MYTNVRHDFVIPCELASMYDEGERPKISRIAAKPVRDPERYPAFIQRAAQIQTSNPKTFGFVEIWRDKVRGAIPHSEEV